MQPDRACKKRQPTPERDSEINQHLLLKTTNVLPINNEDQFSIRDTTRSPFHLRSLEASDIRIRRPNLCTQKEFAYTLNLTVQMEFRFVSLVHFFAFEWPICATALQTPEGAIHKIRPCFLFSLRRVYTLKSASRKVSRTNSFSQSYTKSYDTAISEA